MGQLQTFNDWLKFVRNGAFVGIGAGVVLFWNSAHSADEITVTIAVPLIIFNCMPVIISGVIALIAVLRPQPQQELPLQVQPTSTRAIPLKYRLLAYGIIAVFIGFLVALAIFLASLTYKFFEVPWAIHPARELSYILFALSSSGILFIVGFFAGVYTSHRFRTSAFSEWFFHKLSHPLALWPTSI
jgi:hypothetical protein